MAFRLRDAVKEVPGMRYVSDNWPVHSGPGQRALGEVTMLQARDTLNEEYDAVEITLSTFYTHDGESQRELLEARLCQIQDVQGSLNYLEGGAVRDDIELFEIKSFAIRAMELRVQIEALGYECVKLPDLDGAIALLDPQGKRIPHFYIYDEYSEELRAARAALKQMQGAGVDEESVEQQRLHCVEIEDAVRRALARQLQPFTGVLSRALAGVARLDLLLGKASMARALHLTRPRLGGATLRLRGLAHPEVAAKLRERGREFQRIDVELPAGVTIVTGANMAGKSVLLQSIQLAQYMAQLGLYVAAQAAELPIVDAVLTSMGDGQDHREGLSSFGAEMLRVDAIVRAAKAGRPLLVLIDELARTTNPTEGSAIVCGVVELLEARGVRAIVTTHYGGIDVPCRRLKVRGFRRDRVDGALGVDNINRYIDYSLEEDTAGEVPHEALQIAQLLGVDAELLQRCKAHVGKSRAMRPGNAAAGSE